MPFGDTAINFLVDEEGLCRCHGLLSPIHSSNGDVARVTDELKCIQQRIAMWKATRKGQRPLSSWFGCCIRDYINEPLTAGKLRDLRADIEKELKWLFEDEGFEVKNVKVESWERNTVNITAMIGNYSMEIPASSNELFRLNSQMRQAMQDLGIGNP